MMRVIPLLALTGWLGVALVFAEIRWFSRPALATRIRPFLPGASAPPQIRSTKDTLLPTAIWAAEQISSLLGVREDISTRLRRIHATTDAMAFRLRQLGWAALAMLLAALLSVALSLAPIIALLLLLGSPLLAFLVLEQQLISASESWKRRLTLELPVVSEQLAMLLSAGYSLGASLQRLSLRSNGCAALDLKVVCRRSQQGLEESVALEEWAQRAGVPAVDRLVSILALNRQASDLGRLVTQEARAIRKDVQRELVVTMERRQQQVWIPVTVAALIPGTIFLAIPFMEALRVFSGQ